MLGENISRIRKEKGLTQEAFAAKLNVVRQTISKWENGTAVPDADMLCRIADALEVSVSVLLGRAEEHTTSEDYKAISNALAEINEQLALRNKQTKRTNRFVMVVVCILVGIPLVLSCINLLGFVFFRVQSGSGAVMVTSSSVEVSPSSVGVIGSADGPTQIYVSSHTNTVALLCYVVFAVLVLIGIVVLLVRRKKHRS